ncbi:MAG: RnfABCDGE type electron transport complex subunit B [Gammaproteobacteria bacterium]|nr:RnfABCDGE type electron transport complex subunit B [Gammaproteobacteria bacterium]MCW8928449.1 RnfABCDGE type electron transport complex subunit B [Gammaproteobacteria bacterium]MCW8958960.1 RnfABCDGE type electron transport complex subunit B [Gammaproteobacteria bacterium]MCW8974063.1 RnfABCDGE type electron transport complex subunit B [Gammaproteobacteria bacterium]MCW8993901.1 RnfABCDGE type electron transport complex subunit B [Gammaproteobacteria bacterium]
MSTLTTIAIAAGFMSALGVVLASVLAVANRKLFVYEDPRIDEVEELLPSTNCGACGTPGCRPFAEALVAGTISPGHCTVNTEENALTIADYLGVDVGGEEKRVARLACAGGSNVARHHAHYQGLESCRAATMAGGGGKGCSWGCLGLADCADVCDFDAIHMNQHKLPVVDADKCTACADCVDICPRDLFSLQPVSHHLWVACKSLAEGDEAEQECEVACTGCEKCSVDAADGLIQITNNLAVINYELNALATEIAIQRCPSGAIVWMGDKERSRKGAKAKKVIRQTALPVA